MRKHGRVAERNLLKCELSLDTNVILDLAWPQDFAREFREEFQRRGLALDVNLLLDRARRVFPLRPWCGQDSFQAL